MVSFTRAPAISAPLWWKSVFWMNIWRSCKNGLRWKFGYTGSVSFLTISHSHFHQIIIHYSVVFANWPHSRAYHISTIFLAPAKQPGLCNLFNLSVLECKVTKLYMEYMSCQSDRRKTPKKHYICLFLPQSFYHQATMIMRNDFHSIRIAGDH